MSKRVLISRAWRKKRTMRYFHEKEAEHSASPEQESKAEKFITAAAHMMGNISKAILENYGHEVSYKINGKSIEDIKCLSKLEIQEQIDLAIKEERFEDAAKLRDERDTKNEV